MNWTGSDDYDPQIKCTLCLISNHCSTVDDASYKL